MTSSDWARRAGRSGCKALIKVPVGDDTLLVVEGAEQKGDNIANVEQKPFVWTSTSAVDLLRGLHTHKMK